jgi:glycine oxidase
VDTQADVIVVGGGVIGLASAWRLAAAGSRVTVVDPAPGSGASRVAAGMLAPVTEAHFGEEPLVSVTLASAAAYPEFVTELADLTGTDVGYRACGTLSVAYDSGDLAVLAELEAFQQRLGLDVVPLSPREARAAEPLLAPGVRGASLAAGDHQVDPRRLTAALLAAAERSGVRLHQERALALVCDGQRVRGVRTGSDELAAAAVVLAAGCWSASLAPPGLPVPVRPVKGQLLRLSAGPGALLRHTVRALVAGAGCYLVARDDGEVVVGATTEEMGFDTTVQAGAVYQLLRDAGAVVPALAECRFAEASAGLRPGTPDNAPLVGRAGPQGLVLATGHYRNGILLAPLTAAAVAAAGSGGSLPEPYAHFPADRFAARAVPA